MRQISVQIAYITQLTKKLNNVTSLWQKCGLPTYVFLNLSILRFEYRNMLIKVSNAIMELLGNAIFPIRISNLCTPISLLFLSVSEQLTLRPRLCLGEKRACCKISLLNKYIKLLLKYKSDASRVVKE